MSASLQYYATRGNPLTQPERDSLLRCIAEHGDPDVEYQCESFGFYEFDSPNYKPWREHSILNGSTSVYEDEEVTHWIALLGKRRALVQDAEWFVKLESEVYTWNEALGAYTPPDHPEPLTAYISFPPDLDVTPEAFRDLVAQRAGCFATDSDAKIAESLRVVLGGEGKILFSCTADMPADRVQELRIQRLLWAITGSLSFPGFENDWLVRTESAND